MSAPTIRASLSLVKYTVGGRNASVTGQCHAELIRVKRHYATQTGLGTTRPQPRRRAVTVLNDDGGVKWGDLTTAEKVARTTQQSFNFGLIAVGFIMTAGVFTYLYTDVFSPQSRTSHFNRAVEKIRRDKRCTELLGPGKEISAYGEASWNKWRRNRPIASTVEKDRNGLEKLYMHFNVSGPLNDGVVHLQMTRHPSQSQFEYRYLSLDVKGHSRIYLENAETDSSNTSASSGFRLFGKRWS